MLLKTELDKEGLPYLKDQLSQGWRLTERLLELELDEGEIYSYLPSGVDINKMTDLGKSFSYYFGIKMPKEHREEIDLFISDYLCTNPNNYVIFETFSVANDLKTKTHKHNYFIVNNYVYDYLHGSKCNDEIREYIIQARVYPFVSIFSNLSNISCIIVNPNKEINENCISEIVINTEHIITGAFDGEGYIIWSKNRHN